ncbi:MAG TPA: AMMECR1 domain-containing protein [Phycisphaerales bacterium]|nr:AMMECR1 domain-containing protein [Phycisphaerales bacterium]
MSLSAEERAQLVSLARQAVEAEVRGQPAPRLEHPTGVLCERRGCFVTLTNRGHLRGCIGTFHPHLPLGEQVVEMGSAAARDPRFVFDAVRPAELPQLKIEVSVLSPLAETNEPEKLRIGVDGIYVVSGGWSGCFLPEVATDMGWDAETFLGECCAGKAGLPRDAWKKPGAKVYLFTSEKFDH